jgi:hypothetical protein
MWDTGLKCTGQFLYVQFVNNKNISSYDIIIKKRKSRKIKIEIMLGVMIAMVYIFKKNIPFIPCHRMS